MNLNDQLVEFSIRSYQRINNPFVTDGIHKHVLKNKHDNFFGPLPDFKFHRWAGSLKSSQALAYNIFSGVENVKFEFDMWALDKNTLHKACIDVAIEDANHKVRMYEVKMFEFANSRGKNKIFHSQKNQKYFDINNYKWNNKIAEKYISFIKDVVGSFKNQSVYGGGIKQLCCHLLGIANEMTIPGGKLVNKKVDLYSLCFDSPISSEFIRDLENYKDALIQFKPIVDNFLREINLDTQITYNGFLSVNGFVQENGELLGSLNYEYVANRYLNHFAD